MNTKLYRRKTHFDGVYRKDMDETWNKIPINFKGLIHNLNHDKWMNLHEIKSSIFDYTRCLPDENHVEYAIFSNLLEDILQILVNFDMVESKNG